MHVSSDSNSPNAAHPRAVRCNHTTLFIAACTGLAIASMLHGCGSIPTALTGGPRVTYARPFPPDFHQVEQLNIQARRDGHMLTLTNSTPHVYEASTLWINRRYSRPIQTFEIGETISLDMREFVDEFSQNFKGGGFFATQRPEDAMLIQLETERNGDVQLLGLVSVGDTPI
jgi:hypothetical protein